MTPYGIIQRAPSKTRSFVAKIHSDHAKEMVVPWEDKILPQHGSFIRHASGETELMVLAEQAAAEAAAFTDQDSDLKRQSSIRQSFRKTASFKASDTAGSHGSFRKTPSGHGSFRKTPSSDGSFRNKIEHVSFGDYVN